MVKQASSAPPTLFREAFEAQSNSGVPAWLLPLRQAAFSRFAELGIPTRHHEEYRFTNVAPVFEPQYSTASGENITAKQLQSVPFGDLPGLRIVFVNGVFAPELSRLEGLSNGVQVGNLQQFNGSGLLENHLARYAGMENQPFVALNTAFLNDGAFVAVSRNSVIKEPIQLLFVSAANENAVISHPRTLILAGENSQVSLIETYIGIGDGVAFSNSVTEIVLEQNAGVDLTRITQENERSFHFGAMQVELGRDSRFNSQNVTLGGAIVRHDHSAAMQAEGAECTLDGMYFAGGQQLIDNHTTIDHALPHCNSHELYKGILDGKARGVFNGKIFVRQDAQKTDAKQTNQTLILSPDATINTKPQLEIFADDVRCTHGATIGQLSETQLFYLRSRGIGKEAARSLLTYAFAAELVERVKSDAVRAEILGGLRRLLPGGSIIEEVLAD
jgi:Fe-S cluster assembly protein SufD